MADRIWDQFLTERDKQVFAASGYGALAEWGKRPALLVIDVNYAFVGEERQPILEGIKKWRNSCGEEGFDAVPVIRELIDVCRAKTIPVIYTTGTRRPDGWNGGSWLWKNSRGGERPKVASGLDGITSSSTRSRPARATSWCARRSRRASSARRCNPTCSCSAATR